MCGGFTTSKNTLIGLNIFYMVVGVVFIFWLYGKTSNGVTHLPIIGGVIACCVILIFISVMGLIGTVKHHQVILFFYMILLFVMFVIEFSMACSCLAVDVAKQKTLVQDGWNSVSDGTKADVQESFNCCGLNATESEHPTCTDLPCCGSGLTTTTVTPNCSKCEPCFGKLVDTVAQVLRVAGSFGLFFSFTQFLGVWLTVRYRNQKDPRGNPSAFL